MHSQGLLRNAYSSLWHSFNVPHRNICVTQCRKLNEPYELNRLSTNICAPRSMYKLNLVKRLFSLYKNLGKAALFHDSMRILLFSINFKT